MVKYQVQYKPINPVTNNPVTNLSTAVWSGAYDVTGSSNPNYDMMFMFVKTAPSTVGIKTTSPIGINTSPPGGSGGSTYSGYCSSVITGVGTDAMLKGDFKRVDNDVWAVYCVSESIKSAMKVAKPLISEYGIENVQICKVVQANIDIVFDEAN